MSKRTHINGERDFDNWREWLDHQYFPGRVWPMMNGFRRGGLAKPATYALILLGALLLAGSLLLAIIALLDSARYGAAGDWTPAVFLGVAGAVISVFGTWMLGWQRARSRRSARRADVGRDAGLRKRRRLKISYNAPHDKRDRPTDDSAGWG